MAMIEVAPGVRIHYEVDDHTDPWEASSCVLMLHGIAESAVALRAWAPHFSRRYRVIRPDLRGFGRSSPLPEGPLVGVGSWADEIDALVRAVGCARVHVVGAKLGALVGMELARRGAPWMRTLTLAGLLLAPGKAIGPWIPQWIETIDGEGVEAWARLTMPGRMGDALPPEAMDWWARAMGEAPAASVKACLAMVSQVGEPAGLERISIPVLVMAAAGGKSEGASFEQRQSLEAVDRLRARFPQGELAAIDAASYHVAATHPDACALRARRFIDAHA